MKKVLWLASWYPNETDPFSGDFIKRQAEAVSIYQSLNVLWVGKYAPRYFSEKTERINIESRKSNLKEYILYYPALGNDNNIFSKIKSLYNYFNKNREFIRQLRKKNELPDIVHVHVAIKAGLIAFYMNWKYKVPYVLTEHWSGYYSVAKDSLFKKSYLTRYLTRMIIKKSEMLLPVSEALGKQINKYWVQVPFQKIPNVVNTQFFYPSKYREENRFRFIHISSLLYPKNPGGIVKSFVELLKQGFEIDLILVGPLNPELNKLIQTTGLYNENILCTGEIPYEQVGTELRSSSALVMFSFYENMPCVILEALCTGVPVIATRVGGIPEVIQEDNGILINVGDETGLLEAMKEMISNYHLYNKENISSKATYQFSYEAIGKRITEVYDSILKNK
jgi:glycosyltransferase involved in cell wall biosynthesis